MVKIPVTIFSAIIITIILLVSIISLSSVLAQEDVKASRLSPSQAHMATETVSEGQTEDTVSKTTDSDTNGKTENEVVKGQEAPPLNGPSRVLLSVTPIKHLPKELER